MTSPTAAGGVLALGDAPPVLPDARTAADRAGRAARGGAGGADCAGGGAGRRARGRGARGLHDAACGVNGLRPLPARCDWLGVPCTVTAGPPVDSEAGAPVDGDAATGVLLAFFDSSTGIATSATTRAATTIHSLR